MLSMIPGSQKELNKPCWLWLLVLLYQCTSDLADNSQGRVPALLHLLIVEGRTHPQDKAETRNKFS